MDDQQKTACCRLAASLRSIAGELEEYDQINDSPTVQHAIEKVRTVSRLIHETEKIAEFVGHPLIRDTLEVLSMAHDAIGQTDVDAEWAVDFGDHEDAIAICCNGIQRAYERCGTAIEVLAAKCHVSTKIGLEPVRDDEVPKDDVPPSWSHTLGKQELKLVKALWPPGTTKSFSDLHNTAWAGKIVQDAAIEKAAKRTSQKLTDSGYQIAVRNGHAQLEKLADK